MKQFLSNFTEKDLPDVHKIGRRYYQITPELFSLLQSTSKNINRQPETAGLFLGEEKGKHFQPSVALLDLISPLTDRKVVIDDKAEWLFLCGRDIFQESIIQNPVKSGLALITNLQGEILGYGKMSSERGIAIENLLDRGDYLRREMSKKKR
ncbi:hypothetical protein ACFL0V_03560 [Nanoarchaeota archaeon]